MSQCRNKRVIEKHITLKEFTNELDSLYKWWKVEYMESYPESPEMPRVAEFHKKTDAQRILDAVTTHNPQITVYEVVDDG